MKKRIRTTKPSRFGSRVIAGLESLEAVLRSREPLEQHFTVRTVEIPDPRTFTGFRIRKLIKRLGMSQAVFAQLIGVSTKLVEAWLAGTRKPSLLARRLLQMIEQDPDAFLKTVRASAA